MPQTRESGTFDGKPAVIVYDSDQKKTHIFWGGSGQPDGFGHNHLTVRDSDPENAHYLRENGRLVVNLGYNPKDARSRKKKVAWDVASMLGESFRKALEFNLRNLRR